VARSIGDHFRAILRPAFERHGFAYAEVLTQWPAIVGAPLAALSAPERIRWPRLPGNEEGSRRRRLGGTLIVRVDQGRAIELQHLTPRIIERINAYYGYGAIAELRIVQGPLPPARRAARAAPPVLDAALAGALDRRLAGVASEPLKGALRRLGTGVAAHRKFGARAA
jgi:hypothetical protein